MHHQTGNLSHAMIWVYYLQWVSVSQVSKPKIDPKNRAQQCPAGHTPRSSVIGSPANPWPYSYEYMDLILLEGVSFITFRGLCWGRAVLLCRSHIVSCACGRNKDLLRQMKINKWWCHGFLKKNIYLNESELNDIAQVGLKLISKCQLFKSLNFKTTKTTRGLCFNGSLGSPTLLASWIPGFQQI